MADTSELASARVTALETGGLVLGPDGKWHNKWGPVDGRPKALKDENYDKAAKLRQATEAVKENSVNGQ